MSELRSGPSPTVGPCKQSGPLLLSFSFRGPPAALVLRTTLHWTVSLSRSVGWSIILSFQSIACGTILSHPPTYLRGTDAVLFRTRPCPNPPQQVLRVLARRSVDFRAIPALTYGRQSFCHDFSAAVFGPPQHLNASPSFRPTGHLRDRSVLTSFLYCRCASPGDAFKNPSKTTRTKTLAETSHEPPVARSRSRGALPQAYHRTTWINTTHSSLCRPNLGAAASQQATQNPMPS